jgi:hypothetical protein
VEILLPELWDPLSGPVYAEEGDQQRFWKLTRRFLDNLAASMPGKRIRAVSGWGREARGGGWQGGRNGSNAWEASQKQLLG